MKRILCSTLSLILASGCIAAASTPLQHSDTTTVNEPIAAPRYWEMATGTVMGMGTAILTTEVLKATVKEKRPDGSSNNSFPSRHTSWAFAGSTLLSNFFYRSSPWYSLGFQAVASAIGAQRIAARRHYASDVISGAIIGIGSAELGTFIARKIFGGRSVVYTPEVCADEFGYSLAVETGGIWWLGGADGAHFCTGYSTGLRGRIPVSAHFGVSLSLQGTFTPIKHRGTVYPLNSAGASAGLAAYYPVGGTSLALEPCLEVGGMRLFSCKNLHHSGWGACVLTDFGLRWQLSRNFAFRGTAGVRMITCPKAVVGLTLGVSSVATF